MPVNSLELARQRPAIQALRVSLDAGLQRGVDEHFDETQSVLLVSMPGWHRSVDVRADDGHDAVTPASARSRATSATRRQFSMRSSGRTRDPSSVRDEVVGVEHVGRRARGGQLGETRSAIDDLPEPDRPVNQTVRPPTPALAQRRSRGTALGCHTAPVTAALTHPLSSCRCHGEHGVQPEWLDIDLGVARPIRHAVAADPGGRLRGAARSYPRHGLSQPRRTDPGEADPAVLAIDVHRPAPAQDRVVIVAPRRYPP